MDEKWIRRYITKGEILKGSPVMCIIKHLELEDGNWCKSEDVKELEQALSESLDEIKQLQEENEKLRCCGNCGYPVGSDCMGCKHHPEPIYRDDKDKWEAKR